MTELKTSMACFNSRLSQAEGRISELKNTSLEIMRNKKKKNEKECINPTEVIVHHWANQCMHYESFRRSKEKRDKEKGSKEKGSQTQRIKEPQINKEMVTGTHYNQILKS